MREPIRLVKFYRASVTRVPIEGFALTWNEALTLLQVFDFNLMACNGYTVILNRDVSRWKYLDEPDSFAARALKLKNIKPTSLPQVSIVSFQELVSSVCADYPLVTIHRERISDEVCYIGYPIAMTAKTFTLREIAPDATWDAKSHRIRFADVTKIDFGGGYETALAAVARIPRRRAVISLPSLRAVADST
jgi:hypothetical protein